MPMTIILDRDIEMFDLSVPAKVLAREGVLEETITLSMTEYRMFLQTTRDAGGPGAHKRGPSKIADMMWHAHILCTEQYQKDCMTLFGRFLHHRPKFASADGPCDDCEDCDGEKNDKCQ